MSEYVGYKKEKRQPTNARFMRMAIYATDDVGPSRALWGAFL
jgi:hypothetical protein